MEETIMLIRSLAGVVGAAVVLLLAVTDVMAQSPTSCKSKTTSQGAGNFTASVMQVTTDQGRRQYKYTISGSNPNKLFLFVHSSLANSITANNNGIFYPPNSKNTSFSGADDAFKVVSHESGVRWTSISNAQNPFVVEVPELAQSDATTTLVIGIGSTYEHCGPIAGPVSPPAGGPSGPLVTTTAHLSFENGCSYFATVNLATGKVTSLTPDPATPSETVGGTAACEAFNDANCAMETGLPFCGGNNVAQPPLQTEFGGTCYYPNNIKFKC
jgi:hypothetical protein